MGKDTVPNIESYVINNGLATNFFPLERGVMQGDPLSPHSNFQRVIITPLVGLI